MDQDWIGYRWLCHAYGLSPVQPFPAISRIGTVRSSSSVDGLATNTYPETYRPEANLAGNLTFAFRYEGVHLEFLARLFLVVDAKEIEAWLEREPTGQYARRVGFLFEWLTGRSLAFDGVKVGNYVEALSGDRYITRTDPVNVPRWRVRDNLPGTRFYCPTIRRTEAIRSGEGEVLSARLAELEAEFGTDMLLRSAVWLTIRESKASFQIEREESQSDRIRRFAAAMERRLGVAQDPLDDAFLAQLQADILGERALRAGRRRSPVFIGESTPRGEAVHYVGPHWDDLPAMLEGLREFARQTHGRSPLVRAGALSFGFVFLHPMTDGNGRISRFLVNDTLRRDGATPAPYILPISATITKTATNRAAYDQILERYSRPLIDRYRDASSFGPDFNCDDGIVTNFRFSAYREALPFWAFPDLTPQCEYMVHVIRESLELDLRGEAAYLQDLHRTRARLKEVIEAPDVELDRLIRSIQENGRVLSGRILAEFPTLEDPVLAEAVVSAVLDR